MLNFVKESIDQGSKFMTIDAPTGTGKSYAAVMISDWYTKEVNRDAKVTVLTNTKILQDQYTKDFDFMASLKGSTSYWCGRNLMSCGEAKLVNGMKGSRCGDCQHTAAQTRFKNETVSLTNYHLMTAYSMYSPDILRDRGAKLLIIDEAHSFEEVFCGFVSSVVSERALTTLDIWHPSMAEDLDNIVDISKLADYCEKVIIPKLTHKIIYLIDEAKASRGKKKRAELAGKADYCDKYKCKMERFIADRSNFSNNWVFEKTLDQNGVTRILVEPIWGNEYLKELFWDKYDHVIFMSGTILNIDIFNFLMGIKEDENKYLSLPCPFDAEKRPIVYLKFGKMSYHEKTDTFKRAVPIIKRILDKNKEYKGIIHSGNYGLSEWIRKSIKDKRLLIHESKTREKTLVQHLESEDETVLVSPSMMTGVDLKDELSRFQIILKVPFPNLQSSKIKKRLETRPDWYNWRTLIDVLQSYGRSIRNEEDWAETYILDTCFDQVIKKDVPSYVKDAIKIKILNRKK